jgi:leucyl/phenylalanyl-tRNA--protein transferase
MADSATDAEVFWVEPRERGIIPLKAFRISRNVQRALRNKPHQVRFNTAFRQVMEACAERDETWINPLILESYTDLHHLGFAHSVEVWMEESLVGGLYGVTLGTAFFGESMFRRVPDADKFALYYCHQRLCERGFTLWDTQFYTDHLGTFGAVTISQSAYQDLLKTALQSRAVFE